MAKKRDSKFSVAAKKGWAVRYAKNGGPTPFWMTPAQWAWHPSNPKGIRRHRFILHDVRWKKTDKEAA
jgi:hypothetical protein